MLESNDIRIRERMISEKLDFFFREKVAVHITLLKFNNKNKRQFINGNLTEKIEDKGYWINERVLGKMRVFISEIFDVDELRSEK